MFHRECAALSYLQHDVPWTAFSYENWVFFKEAKTQSRWNYNRASDHGPTSTFTTLTEAGTSSGFQKSKPTTDCWDSKVITDSHQVNMNRMWNSIIVLICCHSLSVSWLDDLFLLELRLVRVVLVDVAKMQYLHVTHKIQMYHFFNSYFLFQFLSWFYLPNHTNINQSFLLRAVLHFFILMNH